MSDISSTDQATENLGRAARQGPAINPNASNPPEVNAESGVVALNHVPQGFSSWPTSMSDTPPLPEAIASYRILSVLGYGGMGVVYRGRDENLNRDVAVKMIIQAAFVTPEELLRFRLEGESLAQLKHPNIVQVYEVGMFRDQPFMALEFVDGGTLSQKLRNGKLTINQVARVIETLARAVHQAHLQGIVHRDLKPGNVLLSSEVSPEHPIGVPKIADFGLAKQLTGNSSLTETGRVLGTPDYMAPEQAGGDVHEIGPQTDVFSLGIILFEMLTGRLPFHAPTTQTTLVNILSREAPRLRQIHRNIPRDLETICAKCLEKKRSKRYASAEELAKDLERFRTNRPIHARPVSAAERMLKWGQRNPLAGALVSLLLLVLILGITGVTLSYISAIEGWQNASEQKKIADEQREAAEISLNFSRLAQAQLQWRLNDLSSSAEMLEAIPPPRRGWLWSYLQNLHHRECRVLQNSDMAIVTGLAFHPDGKRLLVAQSNPYSAVTVDKKQVVPGRLEWWDIATGKREPLVDAETPITGEIDGITISQDGKRLAVHTKNRQLRVWDLTANKRLWVYQEESIHPLSSPAFSKEGKHLVVARHTEGINVFDTDTGAVVKHIPSRLSVFQAHWLPQEEHLLVRQEYLGTTQLLIMDWRKGTVVREIALQPGPCKLSPDGSVLAVIDRFSVKLYSLPSFTLTNSLSSHSSSVADIAFSADSQLLATASADTTARLWDVAEGRQLAILRGHTGRVTQVAFHPSTGMIASGSAQPAETNLWDLTREQEQLNLAPAAHNNWILALNFDPERPQVQFIRATGDREIFDRQTGAQLQRQSIAVDNDWMPLSVRAMFSRDGKKLLGLARDKQQQNLVLWNLKQQPTVEFEQVLPNPIRHVATNADGSIVAAATAARRDRMKWALGVWDTKNKKQRFFEESDAEMTQGVILDDTGTHLLRWASTVRERKIVETFVEFRDLSKVIHRIPVTTNRAVLALAMSGDGKWLAAGDHAGKVWIWDRATGKPLHDGTVLCSNRTGLEALAFSPDGKLLAGSTRTHTALWDVLSGHELTVMTATPQRDWDPGMTPRLAWSPDGQRLASSGWDNSLALWEGGALPDEQEKLKGYQARLTDWQLAHAAKSLHRREKPAVEYQLQQIALAGNLTQRHRVKRADLFVQLGEVSKARADLEQALKHESLDQLFTEWFHLAALLAIEGNVEEYRRLCEKFAAGKTPQVHFGQLHDVLNSCTFLPNALRDQRVLLPLADSAQKQADEIFLRHNPEAKVGAKVLFGAEAQLAYFRAGEYTKFLTHSELADNPRENLGAIDLLTLYLLAMSYQHTGHIEKARQWFKRAEDTFSRADKIREEKKERFLEGLTWVQHARTLQLQKEARQLLGRLPPAK